MTPNTVVDALGGLLDAQRITRASTSPFQALVRFVPHLRAVAQGGGLLGGLLDRVGGMVDAVEALVSPAVRSALSTVRTLGSLALQVGPQ